MKPFPYFKSTKTQFGASSHANHANSANPPPATPNISTISNISSPTSSKFDTKPQEYKLHHLPDNYPLPWCWFAVVETGYIKEFSDLCPLPANEIYSSGHETKDAAIKHGQSAEIIALTMKGKDYD